MNGPQNLKNVIVSQDRQNPGHVQKKSVARFRTGPKYIARCMDVQLGVWKVVPRAEVCVQINCWLGPLLAGSSGLKPRYATPSRPVF